MIIPTQYLSSVLSAHPTLDGTVCRLTSTFTTSGSAGLLGRRDLEQTATDLKSSWDSCMDKTVCKWVALLLVSSLPVLCCFGLSPPLSAAFALASSALKPSSAAAEAAAPAVTAVVTMVAVAGNESYVVQHQNPAPVINNHYYDANNRAEPEYLTIRGQLLLPTRRQATAGSGTHSGGYQKLNAEYVGRRNEHAQQRRSW